MDNLEKAARINHQMDKERNINYKDLSKQRLCKIMKKKITTSLIGSLARFEKFFGSNWGHEVENPTEQQILYKKLWELCRNEILTHGNNQLRALEKELQEYDINWNRHSIILKKKEESDE
jgi:hypothetical protein